MTINRRKNRDTEYIKRFGENLRRLRKEQGLSQEQLANQSDLWLSIVGRVERGEIDPTISTIKLLAKGLSLKPNELFEFQE